jgi:4-hydroxy-tetrahydrodipicolinate synthase
METTRRGFFGTVGAATTAIALPDASKTEAVRSGPRFYVPSVTPCERTGRFDEGLYKDMMPFFKERGADGVVVLGTTGEFASFAVAERKKIAETALKHRAGLEMIVHVGTSNLPETLELLSHAAAHGADAALCVPPFYFKNPRLEGLVAYFSRVLETARIPVYLYHIPAASGVPITSELLRSLERYPRLAGIKDSSGNAEGYANFVREFPKLNIMTGTDNNLEAALQAGKSAILGSGHLLTRQIAAVFAARRQGKDVAEPLARLKEASQVMRGTGLGGVAAIKYALGGLGLRESYVRPPQVDLTAEQKAQLKPKLAQVAALT